MRQLKHDFAPLINVPPIDHGLSTTSEIGWNLERQAVTRRHNSHAHSLARVAVGWANDLRLQGVLDCRTQVDWRNLTHTSNNVVVFPAWPCRNLSLVFPSASVSALRNASPA